MHRSSRLPDAGLWLAACLLGLLTACSTPLETVRLPAVGPGWVPGNVRDFGEGQGTIAEYVPVGEQIVSWTQLITIQFLEGSPLTPEQAMAGLRQELLDRCPGAFWVVLDSRPHSITYEWRIARCAGQETQAEVARLLQGNDGLHRVAYTVRAVRMDPTLRNIWLDRIAAAFVIKGDDQERVLVE